MYVNVSNHILMSYSLNSFTAYLVLFGYLFNSTSLYILYVYIYDKNIICIEKMPRGHCKHFFGSFSKTQLEGHLHSKVFQLLPQHLVQTSAIAFVYYISVIICFPLSWELLRSRELALLTVTSPAPGRVYSIQ